MMESTLFAASLALMLLAFAATAFAKAPRGSGRAGALPRALGIGALASCLASALLRSLGAGRLPFASMYEFGLLLSLVLDGLFVVASFLAEDRIVPEAAALCAFAAGSASLLLFEKARPLAPALKSAWLVAHVGTAVVAYGCLALSAAFAVGALARSREPERASRLEALVTRCAATAFPFLTLLIVTGAIWAESAWGSFWSWDPKETWALVTWLVYLGYLHLVRARGWRGKRAMAAALAAFCVVLFTFFGVNLLMAGLHSYR
jgi:ABC-type transport system involved in cytochrome c biogenesis permease subunit